MGELPDGWVEVKSNETFEQISTTNKKVKTKECFDTGLFPVIDQGQKIVAGYVDDESKVIEVVDPVCIFGDHTRIIKWVEENFVPGADGTKVLAAKEFLLPRYFYYQLRELELPDKGYSRHFQFLKQSKFRVAPLNEQIRIANKLDSLLAKVEAAQTRLDKIPTLLKRFRQSVLAAATSGELTAEWRQGKQFGKKVNIGDITSDIKYGTSKKCSYESGNTPVLRIPNINDWGISLVDLKFADFDPKEKEKLSLKPSDLLIIRSNGSLELVGKVAIITGNESDCLYAGYLIRIRFSNLNETLPQYIFYALRSPEIRKVIEINARSTSGVNNINSKEIAALSINLPSIDEQKQIVRRVESLFTLADTVEKQYQQARQRTDKLTQSLLAKAFRGELVPQDPSEEPAEKLLARIQAEREKLKPAKKTRKPCRRSVL